ncbi:VWA domain-containing protein [Albimonas sp. CAU 1670]|uniref:vWA domain-containing protein n=1 Tax=Albimonas sp. CAU 1670 TaxID=3032599 RepID=UPI0023DB272E|nr:vWA domain-containing protein [Albimonas sp. CAU 1670]MDF2235883.1 VWA domain-containing protein [Albimonas sp. CAU 1670]
MSSLDRPAAAAAFAAILAGLTPVDVFAQDRSVSERLDQLEAIVATLEDAAPSDGGDVKRARLSAAQTKEEAALEASAAARAEAEAARAALGEQLTAGLGRLESLIPPAPDAVKQQGGALAAEQVPQVGEAASAVAPPAAGDPRSGNLAGGDAATAPAVDPASADAVPGLLIDERSDDRVAVSQDAQPIAAVSDFPEPPSEPRGNEIEGLHARVLTRPGAAMIPLDGGAPAPLPPFTILYDFGEHEVDGARWIAVGRTSAHADGWIPHGRTETWKTMLVMEYAPRGVERDRVLFFRDHESLISVVQDQAGEAVVEKLYDAVARGENAGGRLLTVEPRQAVGANQTYLMPILDFDRDAYFEYGAGHDVMLLELAGLTGEAETRDGAATSIREMQDRRVDPAALSEFVTGVVFVMDTTTSMGPYVEASKDFVENIYTRLGQSGVSDRFRFGLVGYRDNIQAVAGVEYLTRIFRDLGRPDDIRSMLDDVKRIENSRVPTRDWREDAFAGVRAAVEEMSWDEVDSRIIVLITDASARDGEDALASIRSYGAQTLRAVLSNADIDIYTLHLRTEEARRQAGQSEHLRGEAQYRALGAYMPVVGDTAGAFRRGLEAVENQLVDILQRAARGQEARVEETTVEDVLALKSGAAELTVDNAEKAAAPLVSSIFRFQQEFLGDYEGVRPPAFYRAWAADRDLRNQSIRSLQVSALLSRRQIETLASALADIVRDVEDKRKSLGDFKQEGGDASGRMQTDPNLLDAISIDFLSALPYSSRLASMTMDQFIGLSFGEQDDMLNGVREKLSAYRVILRSDRSWMQVNEDPADDLYPLPLRDLP